MRFVPTKTPEQQSCLMLHRTRHLFIRQQTAVINSIRAHLAEFGIVAPVGRKGVTELLNIVADPNDKRVSEAARPCLAALGGQLSGLKQQIAEFDRMILAWHRSNTSKRLQYIPGVGPMLATALVASVADPGLQPYCLPPMVLWLGEAGGVKTSLIIQAKKAALGASRRLQCKSAAIRRIVPWSKIEESLLNLQRGLHDTKRHSPCNLANISPCENEGIYAVTIPSSRTPARRHFWRSLGIGKHTPNPGTSGQDIRAEGYHIRPISARNDKMATLGRIHQTPTGIPPLP